MDGGPQQSRPISSLSGLLLSELLSADPSCASPGELLQFCSFLHHISSCTGAIVEHVCTYLVSQGQARVGIPIRLLELDDGDES